MSSAAKDYWFDFTSVPPVGLRIRYCKTFISLVAVHDHVRSDGAKTHILEWLSDEGKTGTSGLRGKAIGWKKEVQK